jgi:hypothetical protein
MGMSIQGNLGSFILATAGTNFLDREFAKRQINNGVDFYAYENDLVVEDTNTNPR